MRAIKQELFDYIDQKLSAHGAAQEAIKSNDARSLLIYAAEMCVGILESGGNNKGPLVELFQETVDGVASGESWCMCFVQSMLAYVEKKLSVKSPILASEHCLTVWKQTPSTQRVQMRPLPGAIVIWKHGDTDAGHTGVMVEWRFTKFEAVEGNTEGGIANGKVVRDGGGVYLTERSIAGTGDMRVVGYLKPF